jgi:glutathione S-transferase
MRKLYHHFLSPVCRKVRIVLGEKQLELDLIAEPVWDRRHDFLLLNPAGTVPVLCEEDGAVLADSTAICEYLDETYPDRPLLPGTALERAEVRRLVQWFDTKFQKEVSDLILGQKVYNRLFDMGEPDSAAIRAGQANLDMHLSYISWLFDRRNWLAGDHLSLADIAAAAHISSLDYLGSVDWAKHPGARDWYMRIKSRPSFRSLLTDRDGSLRPAPHYADLDF